MSAAAPGTEAHGPFYIADWLVEPALNRLSRGETSRRVEPKAMDVLVYLGRRPGQVVSKDELLDSVWSGSFVTEHVLVREIWQLRQALGDGDYIQTVPKRGYRLTAPVRLEHEVKPSPTTLDPDTPLATPRLNVYILALLVLALLIIIGAVFAFRHRPPDNRISSLAVLPLANFSGDSGQDYLADAFTEELTTDLSKIAALRVISRTSAMQYRGTTKKIPDIARELNVDAVLEGSIQQSGKQVRVTVQLIKAGTERHLWAESYTRDLKDVLALREELASAIAHAVNISISAADRARLQRGRTSVPAANEAYTRGRHLADRGEWPEAIVHFEQAVQSDPKYGMAWADLAEAYGMSSFGGARLDLREKRLAAIIKARELDPDLPEVHDLIGDLNFYRDHLWSEGQAEYRRAVESDPGSFDAQYHYALSEWVLGRKEAALQEMRRAQSLAPLSPVVNNSIGELLLETGRAEESAAQFRRVLEMEPSFLPAYKNLGRAYEKLGRYDEAASAYSDGLKRQKFTPAELEEFQQVLRTRGLVAFQRRVLEKELQRVQKAPNGPSELQVAMIYAGLGQKDLAFQHLDRSIQQQVGGLVWLKVRPEWDPLRSDPRFQQLMRSLNFPE